MKVEVTLADIDDGTRGSNCKCPVALAMRRKRPCIRVFFRRAWSTIDEGTYLLPLAATRWIQSFDSGARVRPITFNARRTK